MTPATLDQLRALHRLAVDHGLDLAAAEVAKLWTGNGPSIVTAEHDRAHRFATGIAPMLKWPPMTTTTRYWADIGPEHSEYGAYLYVDGSVTFHLTGIKWRVPEIHMATSHDAAAYLAQRAWAYLRDWRQSDNYGLRDLMRFRHDAVEALYEATRWALLDGGETP